MLGIKIKNRFLSLLEDTSLSFQWEFPIALIIDGGDVIHSGYTFPIDVPLDSVNREIIGHVNRVDNDGVLMADEYCEVWVQGIMLYKGRATLERSKGNRASLFMTFNEVKLLADTSLSAIDLGGTREIGADEATRMAHLKATATTPLDHDYVFCPVLNPIFNTDPTGVETSFVSSHLQNEWDPEDEEFKEVGAGYASPFIRVDYLLRRIFQHMGYTLDNQFQITDELKLLLLYNNYSIYSTFDTISPSIDLVNHVPYRKCLEFVKAVIGTYALCLFPDPFDKVMRLIPFKTLIQSPVHMDLTSLAGTDPGIEADRKYVSRFRYDIDVDDALSIDYSGVTFNQAAVQDEGLTVYDLEPDITLFNLGPYYIQSDNTYYFMLISDPGINCSYMLQDQKEINHGTTDQEYISPLIPMWSSWALGLDGLIHTDTDVLPIQAWLVPHIRMTGNGVNAAWLKKPQQAFRTMLYRGMQPYNVGVIESTYPMAGVTRYNILGDVVGDHSLLWDVEGGVYDTWWKLPYEILRRAKTVDRRMRLGIAFLLQFRFWHKYRIENQNYFFTKLEFTASNRGLSPVTVTMISTL